MSSYLDLTVHEVEREHYPSMRLSLEVLDVAVVCKVQASIRDVWIELASYEAFLRTLEVCERERRSRAALSAMNPNEFNIVIEFVGTLGKPVLSYDFRTSKLMHDGRRDVGVTGAFDLDPSMMANIISELQELIASE